VRSGARGVPGSGVGATEGRSAPAAGARARPSRAEAGVGAALVLAFLLALRAFALTPFVVRGESMSPTLAAGEEVLVDKLAYAFSSPRPGQIVVFRPPLPGARVDYVKRVVAVAGESVGMVRGRLYVNGRPVAEPYVRWRGGASYPTVLVPPGDVFVLGDDRPVSLDSRYFGPVPVRDIVGQVVLGLWPPHRLGPVGAAGGGRDG
jgi:signal peptidase I